ncbi:hypothetical protein ACIQMR_10160 [Streptomyces sp. NPDC091376]|uniref:hypothetical protein n=1 Tax=Streptomyces sp. NPDC091376 TaxID=3365994 RepID=UPI00382FE603
MEMIGVKVVRAAGPGLLAAALLTLPVSAHAADGDFYWSTSGLGGQDAVLASPESGRCYSLRGDNAPFYASNHTGRTVRSYESRGCRGEAQSSIEPGGVGHVYKYVKFG